MFNGLKNTQYLYFYKTLIFDYRKLKTFYDYLHTYNIISCKLPKSYWARDHLQPTVLPVLLFEQLQQLSFLEKYRYSGAYKCQKVIRYFDSRPTRSDLISKIDVTE